MSSHNTKTDYTMDDFRAEMRRRNEQGKALKRRPLTKGPTMHAPRIAQDRTRITQIVGCACGWSTPPGVTDSDAAFAQHAVMR